MARNRIKRLKSANKTGDDQALIRQAVAELRFDQQHLVASYNRVLAAQAFDAVRSASPDGAYWMLDVTAKTHTRGCIEMSGRNWPWSVLVRVHPLRHHGCRCALIPASPSAPWGNRRDAAHILMETERAPRHDDGEGPWGLRSKRMER